MADLAVICTACGNTLGLVTDGELEIRHKDRVIRGLDADSPTLRIRCEDCGAEWNPLFPLKRLAPARTGTA